MKLIDFYIENKNRITLHFEDGSSKTVPVGRLKVHIDGEELAKVMKALELKRSYLRRFPNWLKVWWAATGAALAVIAASGKAATPLWRPSEARPNQVMAITQTPVEAIVKADAAGSVTPEQSPDLSRPGRVTSDGDEAGKTRVDAKGAQNKKDWAYKEAVRVLKLKDRPSNNLF